MLFKLGLIFTIFIHLTLSVDRGNFKTCQDSGFCRMHRSLLPGKCLYEVDATSLSIGQTFARFDIANTQFKKLHFTVYLYSYITNTIRMRIEEINPIRERFNIPPSDVFIHEQLTVNLRILSQSNAGVMLLASGERIIVINYKPFSMEIYQSKNDTRPFVRVNGDGLLKYEHFRTRTSSPSANAEDSKSVFGSLTSWFSSGSNSTEQQRIAAAEVDSRNEDGEIWEETFKTIEDKKPFGPSSVGVDITFVGFDDLFGLPEHADTSRLKATKDVTEPYRLYNLDVFEYEVDNPMALYGSIPFVYAHSIERSAGVVWLNPAETWVDVDYRSDSNSWTHFMSETGFIDVFIFSGPRPKDVISQFSNLFGTVPVPPLFSLGYHQSRWNYNDDSDVAAINDNFDQHGIPCDVIWIDIEHTDGKRYFTWNSARFPNPIEMLNNLSACGRRSVTSLDPHLKIDENYDKYSASRSRGYFIKDRSGKDYEGSCWPGSSAWLDFVSPDVRLWWAEQISFENYPGSADNLYSWNDMNEPSVFSGPEVTMHKDALHIGGYEHREVHNIYGHYVAMATFNGLLKRSHHKLRPFVLSRSFFLGTQRYAAVWTGDNLADWQHLRITTPMLLSLSISGIAFCGSDIGGFFKNPDTELLTRWYQAAAFHPFFREHSHIDTRRREPWVHDADTLARLRAVVLLRYSYLPYWYTLFFELERTGIPPMRPAWLEFSVDPATFSAENSFMVGSAIFVCVISEAGQQTATFYLPGNLWYRADEWSTVTGGKTIVEAVSINAIPVFHRGGSIISRWLRPRRSSQAQHSDPLTLVACLDEAGRAEGRVFIDEFDGYKYKHGLFAYRVFFFENDTFTSRSDAIATAPVSSEFTSPIWIERIVIVGMHVEQPPVAVTLSIADSNEKHILQFEWDLQHRLLVIRRPGVSVISDFDVSLHY